MERFDEQILSLQKALSQLAEGDDVLPQIRHRLAVVLFQRCQATGNAMDDLSAAIFQETRNVEEAISPNHTEQQEMAMSLTEMLYVRWERSQASQDLEAVLERGLQTLTILREGCPKHSLMKLNIARLLLARNQGLGDLDKALELAQGALLRSENDPRHAYFLFSVAEIQFARYRRGCDGDELDDAITRVLQAQTLLMEDDPMQKKLCSCLEHLILAQDNESGNIDDLDAALKCPEQYRTIPTLGLDIHENRELPINIHYERFLRSGNVKDIDKAILHAKTHILGISDTCLTLPGCLVRMAYMYAVRFSRLGLVQDSKEWIDIAKRAVDITLECHFDRVQALCCFASALSNHNTELSVKGYIDEHVVAIENTLSHSDLNTDDRAELLTKLGMILMQRSQETKKIEDLEAGICRAKEALTLSPSRMQRVETLDCLSGFLHVHFDFTGDEDSMNAAVANAKEMAGLLRSDDRDRSRMMIQYARQLTNRSLRTGNTGEMDKAISIYQEINGSLEEDHFLRRRNFDGLAILFKARFERTGTRLDMEMAIGFLRKSIEQVMPGSQEHALKLLNLGTCLSGYFDRTKCSSHLDDAIEAYENALTTSFNTANKETEARCLYSVAGLYHRRYEIRTRSMAELHRAIDAGRKAVSMLDKSHPELVTAHCNLGSILVARAKAQNDLRMEDALESFLAACNIPSGKPDYRIMAAQRAMRILAQRQEWVRAGGVADVAIKLLTRVCSRKLRHEDQTHALKDISSVARDACSIQLKLGNISKALQQIEFGRGLILGYIIDGQSDLSDLEQQDHELAKEYRRLRVRASEVITESDDAYSALERCEVRIRQLPGFENFLLQPRLEKLHHAAREGPIVIVNFSDLGADAIIVFESDLKTVDLSRIMQSSAIVEPNWMEYQEGGTRDVEPESAPRWNAEFLSLLWSTCVHPVLEQILSEVVPSSDSSKMPRVWWIGTGAASQLPFHAATSYGQGVSISTLDLVISSYTPTIKALENARYRATRSHQHSEGDPQSLLIVTMPSTPGETFLPGVTKEREAIKRAIESAYSIKELEHPDVHQVLDHMKRSQIVHFACHGAFDSMNPLDSHLLLQKSTGAVASLDKLTVKSLFTAKAETQARIAYLSACSTARVDATGLADESLHVTSAFQVAGFAHVIGSLWSVDDSVSVKVAELFYDSLKRSGNEVALLGRAVAEALRNAMLAVRQEFPDQFDTWAPYLHYGA